MVVVFRQCWILSSIMFYILFFFFFFSSRRRHTRCREVSWARRCVQETAAKSITLNKTIIKSNTFQVSLKQEPLSNISPYDIAFISASIAKANVKIILKI
eukprot:TRINITY_DN35993_c0_g1_i4.p4 TRINITY_DN35993_c0_g1~~TRINITY_DN35993_c0_g1_i4.p4  ORF type:complete len:100 (-),score=29.71 TRINITY_DN35993_c0_g1_i4:258-557(-)